MRKIDAHIHVWAHDPEKYPYREGIAAPTAQGDAQYTLSLMDASGVEMCVIIQPIVHGFDHSYVDETLAKYPDRFAGVALVDPSADDPVAMLDGLIDRGYRGVRLNPALFPEGETLSGPTGRALVKRVGELGIVGSFLVTPEHFDDVEALCSEFPGVTLVIDHLGHTKADPAGGTTPEFDRLIDLSRHPNLYVKTSQFARQSNEEYPYRDTFPLMHRLIDAYGSDRLMWATDFPVVVTPYDQAWKLAGEIEPSLSEGDKEKVLGGNVARLFGL
jgi:predicted TIM-barrel fold metal-dependent hydrolase